MHTVERIHFCTFSPPSSSFYSLFRAHSTVQFGRMRYLFFRSFENFQFCFLITISVNAIMYAYRHIVSNIVTNMCVLLFTMSTVLMANKRLMRIEINEEKWNNTKWMDSIPSYSFSFSFCFGFFINLITSFFLFIGLYFFHWIQFNISYLSVIIHQLLCYSDTQF